MGGKSPGIVPRGNIAAIEGLNETASQPAPTKDMPERVVISEPAACYWQVRVLLDESSPDIARRITFLKERAKGEPVPKILNLAPEAAKN